jgi:type II secretory pathway pseudopilin PulG
MSSPSRFSLSGLLIGIAIVSVLLAAVAYALKGANVALEAENNLHAYSGAAEALNAFVERHRRWPRDEAELREFDGQPAEWPERRDHAIARTIVAYDFDLLQENLDSPETFRGLRQKDPNYGPDNGFVEILLATLRELRDSHAESPVPVGQAVPDDAEEPSAGDANGSR